jgi:hypothetical protein
VHTSRSQCRSHPHSIIPAVEIASLDEFDTHAASKEGMLVVGGVVHPRGQHHDGRIGHRCSETERVLEPIRVFRHRSNNVTGEYLGQNMAHRATVLQNVGHSRGIAQIVLQHPKLTLFIANQIDPRNMDAHTVRRDDPPSLSMEVRR